MRERDKDEIRHQIDATLRAYIEQDWEKLRGTHDREWCGFGLQAGQIVKGVDALIALEAQSGVPYRLQDYEMVEIDYRFFGNMCVTPYVARVRGVTGQTGEARPFAARLQSICVYQKQQGEWRLSVSDFQVTTVNPVV